jgi:CheY-like chemotaxis protein
MQGFMFAQREVPDLILLDINMPAGGGMTVFDRLHHSAKTREIPVIVVTAVSDAKTEADSTAHGARAVLHKPIDKEILLQHVAAVVSSAG